MTSAAQDRVETTPEAAKTSLPNAKGAIPVPPAPTAASRTPVKATVKAPAKKVAATRKAAQTSIAKPVVTAAAKPAVQKLLKDKKVKLEYLVLEELKLRCGKLGHSIKKSELIRAGIKALASFSDANFLAALKAVPTIKTGRPTKK